ncbi:MAG: hypothetical protein COX77_00690 [Candidatus Komeilibacteria bacterium CG_4_10_14_0_2_um_filter_37_10]|uniref:N-acetyltransferase domain-containing protein n=1 Tax=Candidatus Komeilibacteria bacterium CG_4_10_14_0_2_um_filter_37_10 TaxID=1974470 RepID=A0A2M7VGC9_9BACT|nr:MAG: hypothetical protein COX77_00690 [Candidatus Komeilibacteria bacterium CG_4_10_14_0_2_um_filter_37_10]PJA94113.1 MAG: hypothetical protein CO133_00700 [Candidatus Komeilibacteria bacterium CG_4_9_14_3_um_filter_37_5]
MNRENIKLNQIENQNKVEIQGLGDFDQQYFDEIQGHDDWIALGSEDYTNQHYFTVFGTNNEKLGIVGVYDTDYEKNVTHTVVDPKYRNQGLSGKFKQYLIKKLDLPFITLTISLDNIPSIKATGKIPNVQKISDANYERQFHKVKYLLVVPK